MPSGACHLHNSSVDFIVALRAKHATCDAHHSASQDAWHRSRPFLRALLFATLLNAGQRSRRSYFFGRSAFLIWLLSHLLLSLTGVPRPDPTLSTHRNRPSAAQRPIRCKPDMRLSADLASTGCRPTIAAAQPQICTSHEPLVHAECPQLHVKRTSARAHASISKIFLMLPFSIL